MRTEGQTDMMKLTVAFRILRKAPKKHNGVDDRDCEGCGRYKSRHETRVRISLIILRTQRERTAPSNHVINVMMLCII